MARVHPVVAQTWFYPVCGDEVPLSPDVKPAARSASGWVYHWPGDSAAPTVPSESEIKAASIEDRELRQWLLGRGFPPGLLPRGSVKTWATTSAPDGVIWM